MNTIWYSDLIDDINISNTLKIQEYFKNVVFTVLEQREDEKNIYRKIQFESDWKIVSTATAIVEKNDFVLNWLKSNKEIAMWIIIRDEWLQLKKELISKTDNSRKYKYIWKINSEIEEFFF